VSVINKLQQRPEWKETAVIVSWDDSDGWYDHVQGPTINPSDAPGVDVLNGASCGRPVAPGAYLGRCGFGPRLPLLVISPWARRNFVDHTLTNQASILRFIEDNWHLGRIDDLDHPGGTPPGQESFDRISGSLADMFDFRHPPHLRPLLLDPITGEVQHADEDDDAL